MARIQILELPTVYTESGSETPFIFVIDQATDDEQEQLHQGRDALDYFLQRAGARALAIFATSMEIPANAPLPSESAWALEGVNPPDAQPQDDAVRLID